MQVELEGPGERGITFAVPRNSLMSAIDYRIFDDLLIGNFMKTTLHGVKSLYEEPGRFNFSVAKYGDNGLVESERREKSDVMPPDLEEGELEAMGDIGGDEDEES